MAGRVSRFRSADGGGARHLALGGGEVDDREVGALRVADRREPAERGGVLGRDRVEQAHAELAMAAKVWTAVVSFARRLTEVEPGDLQGWVWWAYALREMQQIREARRVLLQIEATHGDDHAIVPYNLACYYCLLGELDTARRYFSKACKMDPHFKESLATDPDLTGLRADIGQP